MKISQFSLGIIAGTVSALVIPTALPVFALTSTEVNRLAKSITVQIDSQSSGSGTLIKREGNIYTVLTAAHVVATEDNYTITTSDMQQHPVNRGSIKRLPGIDLATLQFTSTRNYDMARLGDTRQVAEGAPSYVAGFPTQTQAITSSLYTFTEGKVTANASRPLDDGYALIYSNSTLPGMSGGPVINSAGEVIGIHGRADTTETNLQTTDNPDVFIKTGFNLGIPINSFTNPKTTLNPSQNPNLTVADYFIQAALKRKEKDYKGAILDLNRALEIKPDVSSLIYFRGLNKFSLKDYPGALADFDDAIRLRPKAIKVYFFRGMAHVLVGNNSEALKDVDLVIQAKTNIARRDLLLNIRGTLKRKLNDYEGAIIDFNQALAVNPKNGAAYSGRGVIKQALKRNEEALSDFNQSIKLAPESSSSYNNRGYFYDELEDYEAAIVDYSQAIKLKPDNAVAHLNRGVTKRKINDNQGALRDLNQAINLDPKQANFFAQRALTKQSLDDFPGAMSDFDQALRLEPKNPITYANRGSAKVQNKQYSSAIADFDEAIRLNPKDAISFNKRGGAKIKLEDYVGALEDFDRSLQLDPKNAITYSNRAVTNVKLENYAEAVKDLDQSIQLDPSRVISFNNRGAAKNKLGDYNSAIADLNQAIRLNVNYAKAYKHRAFANQNLGNLQESLKDYRKAAELFQKEGDNDGYQKAINQAKQVESRLGS